jgi:DNA-binding MarR family transcriptional regulator
MKAVESPAGAGKGKSRERVALERRTWELLGDLYLLQKPRVMALCREFDLFPPQLLVLKTLDHPRPMREVAATMGCDSSNLTGITDRLEERGLVMRTADPDDRRVKRLVLTDDGKRLRRQIVAYLGQPPPGAIDALSERDLTQLQRLLAKALR